ncbi:MAG: hypothetical protein HYV34_01595 [Candidatus Kerfeldbacteria bacterium]|nr:hypothetical protein [Candidatus Kerfeldbacteria bacterium]
MERIHRSVFSLSVFFVLAVLFPSYGYAAYGDTTTWMSAPYDGDGDNRLDAYLDFPHDVTVDADGQFIIADTENNVIRRVRTNGLTETLAGNGSYGNVDSTSAASEFARPRGVAVDSSGNVYVADTENNAIRKISGGRVSTLTTGVTRPEGVVVYGSTLYIADTGNGRLVRMSTGGGDVVSFFSSLESPKKIVISDDGEHIYVADSGRAQIMDVAVDSETGTVLSGSGSAGYTEGAADDARFRNLWGIALDGDTLYVSDGDGTTDFIRSVNVETGETELFADDNAMVSINYPAGLVVSGSSLYVANSGLSTIHKFSLSDANTNEIYVGADRFGNRNGERSQALLGRPWDLELSDDRSTLYIAENNLVKKYEFDDNELSLVAGDVVDSYREATGATARFSNVAAITVDSDEEYAYVADRWNNRIRRINLDTGETSLLAGGGESNTSGDDDNGYDEGTGDDARFNHPGGIVISPDDQYLYVSDSGNDRIRRVRISDWSTALVAGSGSAGLVNGTGSAAKFNRPWGITIDGSGRYLYVADSNNHVIRRITIATREVVTIAGKGWPGYRDALGTNAYFSVPEYVEWADGNFLYVSEVGDHRLRIVDLANNLVQTVAGSSAGYQNGSAARFHLPKGLAPDSIANVLYVADSANDVIRRVTISDTVPFADSAPTVTGVNPSSFEKATSATQTIQLQVTGTHFLYGATVQFGTHVASKVYFQSSTSLAAVLPFGSMPPGHYDVKVTNVDGQSGTKASAFAVLSNGVAPATRYSISGTDPDIAEGDQFFAFASTLRGGYFVASGDVTSNPGDEIVVAAGDGMGPQVRVFKADGFEIANFFAYDTNARFGARVAVGDVDGDGENEIVTVPGIGGTPHVRVFKANGTPESSFMALDGKFKGGAYIAIGNVLGESKDQIVIAAGKGGGPHVTVHRSNGTAVANFFAYDRNFRNGITVATVDTDGDGKDEIVTGPEFGSPHIQFFAVKRGSIERLSPGYYAFDPNYKGGVNVSGVDITGDGKDEIMISSGVNAEAWVKIYNKSGTAILEEFIAYPRTYTGGTRVAGGDVDNDGVEEALVIPRSNGSPQLRVIDFN